MLRAKYSFTNQRLLGHNPVLNGYGRNGLYPSKGVTSMRVFCPEHKRGFFAPRQSPIKCENRGHILGELDFAGEGKSPFEFQWQYCCNCEHFSLVDFDEYGLQRCSVCTRRSSTLFLCDRCYTLSFESNPPLQTKNFTLTEDGVPKPCCPGCLHPASADLREHTCEVAAASFVTGLKTCPVCHERLDVGPSFPSSLSQYLRRTRAANKSYVTFDYETELFVPIEDGEFILIQNNDESGKTFIVPRSPRLGSARDFYELYQDYYHCVAPQTGEIHVTEPAVVTQTNAGWKFQTPGVLEISEAKKETGAGRNARELRGSTTENARDTRAVPVAVPEIARETRAVPEAVPEAVAAPVIVTECSQCGTAIESKYSFCWKCGHRRTSNDDSSELRPQRSRLVVSTHEDEAEAQRLYQQSSGARPTPAWASAVASEPRTFANRSVLKLFGIGIGALLAVSLAVFTFTRSSPEATPVSAAGASTPSNQTTAPVANTGPVQQQAEIKPASLEVPTTSAEDSALQRLRQLRAVAATSGSSKVLQKLSEIERKYADDYRFPYERAKLAILDHQKNFHETAFAALRRAAQKAIHNGKAGEMLDNLNKDKYGDFQQLAHGHPEWAQLQKALKSEDTTVLPTSDGF